MDCDLGKLNPEDLWRVRVYLEDRLVNAVTPLDIRLQLEQPGVMACDLTCQEARRTVDRVMAIVDEIRALSDRLKPLAKGG